MQRSLIMVVTLASVAQLFGVATANQRIYQSTLHSTAWIINGQVSGSGAIVDTERRLIVTNFHVVGASDEVMVCFAAYRGERVVAEREYYAQNLQRLAVHGRVKARDPKRDLALVEVDSLPDTAKALSLATDGIGPGDNVHSIGNPGDASLWIYSRGTVRQVAHETLHFSDLQVDALVVETQSPVNPGDSGGPVVNDDGELVAITQSRRTDMNQVSYCIDVSEVRALMNGEVKTIDRGLAATLDGLHLVHNVNFMGVFETDIALGNGIFQKVFINSKTERIGTLEIREVYAPAFVLDGPPPPQLAANLLAMNHRMKVGGWEIWVENNRVVIVFCAKLPIDVSPETLATTLNFVGAIAHASGAELREVINRGQQPPVREQPSADMSAGN